MHSMIAAAQRTMSAAIGDDDKENDEGNEEGDKGNNGGCDGE